MLIPFSLMSFILKYSPFLTNLDSLPSESMSAVVGEFSTVDIEDFTTDFHIAIINFTNGERESRSSYAPVLPSFAHLTGRTAGLYRKSG
jgi:hypothetical protein